MVDVLHVLQTYGLGDCVGGYAREEIVVAEIGKLRREAGEVGELIEIDGITHCEADCILDKVSQYFYINNP